MTQHSLDVASFPKITCSRARRVSSPIYRLLLCPDKKVWYSIRSPRQVVNLAHIKSTGKECVLRSNTDRSFASGCNAFDRWEIDVSLNLTSIWDLIFHRVGRSDLHVHTHTHHHHRHHISGAFCQSHCEAKLRLSVTQMRMRFVGVLQGGNTDEVRSGPRLFQVIGRILPPSKCRLLSSFCLVCL